MFAVFCFWLIVIVLILRRPITELMLAQKKPTISTDSVPVSMLETRIQVLERELHLVNRELHELREAHEFTTKLLTSSGNVAPVTRTAVKV